MKPKSPANGPKAPTLTLNTRVAESARLVVIEGPNSGGKFPVDRGVVLGRSDRCSVPLTDQSVSREHARITRVDESTYRLDDLNSRNGTFVNGIRVHSTPLKPGDKIRLGVNTAVLFTYIDPLEEQLLQRQRLETLGRLVAGITHDLNNLLAAIRAGTDYLGATDPNCALGDARVRESLGDIRLAASQAGELTARILSFARGEREANRPVNVSRACDDIVRLVRHVFDRSIVIKTNIEPNLHVRGSSTELQQALMNLCVNARDAMPNGGTLHVEAATVQGNLLPAELGARDAAYVVVRVQDQGIGMTPDTLERIFEPFFSLKRDSGGYGLGLATVRDVAQTHGGMVDVQSSPGHGSTFSMFVPASRERSELERTDPARSENRVRSEPPKTDTCVMIVDDEPLVRRAVARVLAQSGYRVVQACNGIEALQMYPAFKPDVVLLDLDMPGIDGEETQARLYELDPNARI
ncbi:MAG TPA: ATP-binding protein, partial [Polyangiaceae bacterium]